VESPASLCKLSSHSPTLVHSLKNKVRPEFFRMSPCYDASGSTACTGRPGGWGREDVETSRLWFAEGVNDMRVFRMSPCYDDLLLADNIDHIAQKTCSVIRVSDPESAFLSPPSTPTHQLTDFPVTSTHFGVLGGERNADSGSDTRITEQSGSM
jgi:hypothetical protein